MFTFQNFCQIGVPVLATALYMTAGLGNAYYKNYPMALMWLAYGFANIGIIWSVWKAKG